LEDSQGYVVVLRTAPLNTERNIWQMNQSLIFGLTILISTSCSEKKENSVDNIGAQKDTTEFVSVYDTLDILNVPVSLTPRKWTELHQRHLERYGVKDRLELLQHPYARLTGNSDYKAVVFISTDETGSPTLITLGKNGLPIDTLYLLGDWSANSPSQETNELVTISKDYLIQLIDSTSTFELSGNDVRIETSRKVTVTNESYRISDKGRIEKIR